MTLAAGVTAVSTSTDNIPPVVILLVPLSIAPKPAAIEPDANAPTVVRLLADVRVEATYVVISLTRHCFIVPASFITIPSVPANATVATVVAEPSIIFNSAAVAETAVPSIANLPATKLNNATSPSTVATVVAEPPSFTLNIMSLSEVAFSITKLLLET